LRQVSEDSFAYGSQVSGRSWLRIVGCGLAMGAYMRGLKNRLGTFWSDRRAITAVEYGLIASAMAFVLVNIFLSLGTPISQIFVNLGTKI
jgi:Flp pilus assembly pilin Flp